MDMARVYSSSGPRARLSRGAGGNDELMGDERRLRELLDKREDELLSEAETAELEELLARRDTPDPDPTTAADRVDPEAPGPGDSEGAPPS